MAFKILKEIGLRLPVEALNISYPSNFLEVNKSEDPDEEGFTLSPGTYSYRTEAEIALINAEIQRKSYGQSLIYTGAVRVDGQEPLLNFSQIELDRIEAALGHVNSRHLPVGGERMIGDRISKIRELGYTGDGTDLGDVAVPVTAINLLATAFEIGSNNLTFVLLAMAIILDTAAYTIGTNDLLFV